MSNQKIGSAPKRGAPHMVSPTTRLLRDSMLVNGNQDLYGSTDANVADVESHDNDDDDSKSARQPFLHRQLKSVERAASQLPAIALVALFHLMVGIPFGVSYFPVDWTSSAPDSPGEHVFTQEDSFMDGQFPIPGKEALGIRMFLFSTIIGQLAMTFASNFRNCIAIQMVENVPVSGLNVCKFT